ncbi:MAG: type II toxin-antitoxin system VapC family toxin [Gracilibacteraceae bacterium]|jgi:tRNA(fMet)-specific endonuclease VapC|nr:type II toxin-antitoxin system VapC family toxin [Gracilibacteraceae bacterium]
MIFFDTNILSYYFNGNIKVKEKIVESLSNKEIICLTAINVYEILKGFRWRENKRKEELFKDFIKKVTVYTVDDEVVNIASDIYADLRKNGKTVGDADILIAAIVISNNGALITNNVKHYADIKQLELNNWA